MVTLEQEVLKEILRKDFATNRRSGKYLLLYNCYAEVLNKYPAHQAAQIISKDLGFQVKDYTIRRAKNAAEKQCLLDFQKNSQLENGKTHPTSEPPSFKSIETLLADYKPVGMEEKRKSYIVFQNQHNQ